MKYQDISKNPTSSSRTLHSANLTSRSFAKLALAGAVALALQSAYAENITVNEGETYTSDIVATEPGSTITNNGTIQNDSIVFNGGKFINTGSIVTSGTINLQKVDQNSQLGGTFEANEIVFHGAGNTTYQTFSGESMKAQKLTLEDPRIRYDGSWARVGLRFSTTEALQNVETIHVLSHGALVGLFLDQGTGTGISYDKTVLLQSDGSSQDARIEVEGVAGATSDAAYYVANVVSESTAGASNKLQITNAGGKNVTFAMDNIHVKNGRLNLQTYADATGKNNNISHSGTFVLKHVALDEGATLRASVYGGVNGNEVTPSTPPLRIEGDITFDMAANSGVDFGGWNSQTNRDWIPDYVIVAADSITINVEDSDGGNYVYLSKNGLQTQAENIRVVSNAANNTGNAAGDLEKIADVVMTNEKDETLTNHLECLPGVLLEQAANDIFDGAVGVVGDGIIDSETGECIGCGVTNIRTIDNPNVHGIAEMTALGLHIWRNEIDDMHRRMGDLRDSAGQANGLWTRIYNGKASFGGQSIENKYTAFQFGYDHQVSPGLWMGGALSYTYGDNDFAHGEGDNSLLAFTAYASRLFDNGLYLDFTGKVGRMKNSFDIRVGDIRSSGDYHTNAVSVSAEAGWRFDVMKNVFFEPQVEVWYGHVFDAQYQTSTNVDVDQASTDSLVGRAGFRLGLECPNNRGTAFIKASVLHDWEGEADFRFSKGGVSSRTLTEDLGGTWYEYGIGGDFNATEQLHFWVELERGDGGEVDTDYRATIGMRYAW